MILLDGKSVAGVIRAELRAECEALRQQGYRPPCLGIVLVGNNPASVTYVNNKILACKEVGIETKLCKFESSISQSELLRVIHGLNVNNEVDGFIVQLPLPFHINEPLIASSIAYNKDVDGLSPENMGRILQGLPGIVSATPKGIRELLRRYDIPTDGKRITIIGRSNIVGKPLANLLIQKNDLGNASITMCHSHTRDIKRHCLEAEIIIVAAGQPGLIRSDMVSNGCVVVDVGINRIEDKTSPRGYRLVGDVDFEQVAPKCSYITPVPGGVGPMTIVSLLQNTLQVFYENRNG